MFPSERICNCFCMVPGAFEGKLQNHQKIKTTALDPVCPVNENLGCKSSGRLALGHFSGSRCFSLFTISLLYSILRLSSLVGIDFTLLYLYAKGEPMGHQIQVRECFT